MQWRDKEVGTGYPRDLTIRNAVTTETKPATHKGNPPCGFCVISQRYAPAISRSRPPTKSRVIASGERSNELRISCLPYTGAVGFVDVVAVADDAVCFSSSGSRVGCVSGVYCSMAERSASYRLSIFWRGARI